MGATLDDVAVECPKVEIGARVIRSLWPEAHVDVVKSKWQDAVELLRQADLIFACVDSARSRLDLETTARRYLIPVIDIGLGLRELQDGPRLHGQVALSMPGGPCLRCLKVLTPAELDADTRRSAYPGFGPAPQVVWSNGVLAATAVGVAMDLLTGWNRLAAPHPLIKYGGNECLVAESVQVPPLTCTHYPAGELGDP